MHLKQRATFLGVDDGLEVLQPRVRPLRDECNNRMGAAYAPATRWRWRHGRHCQRNAGTNALNGQEAKGKTDHYHKATIKLAIAIFALFRSVPPAV